MSNFLMMGDLEDDPYFGAHMQRMNSMMSSMFGGDPFGMMGGPPAIMGQMGGQSQQLQMPGMQMMPFGFPSMGININSMFSNMQNMGNNPNCHSFSSSSVTTMTTGPDGRPQVYQESMSSRTGPGGVKETKQTVSNSVTGQRKLAIGRHIGERAHIIEREKNEYTGDQEEREDYINLDEEEADSFNQEWQSKARRTMGAIGNSRTPYSRSHQNPQLALPSTAPSVPRSDDKNKSQSKILKSPVRAVKNALSSKKIKDTDAFRSVESTTSNSVCSSSNSKATPSSSSELPQDLSSNSIKNRKREHSPEIEEIENPNKRRSLETKNNDEK